MYCIVKLSKRNISQVYKIYFSFERTTGRDQDPEDVSICNASYSTFKKWKFLDV